MLDAELSNVPWLRKETLRRLLVGHIAEEQAQRIKNYYISRDQEVFAQLSEIDESEIDSLKVDEATLGFDSLAMLDLVLRLNVFFGLHRTGVEDYLLVRREIGSWIELLETHREHLSGPMTLKFHTSGSTGPQKPVEHSLVRLQREIDAHLVSWLRLNGEPTQVIALVPPTHIYGFLFTCLLPDRLGVEVVDLHRRSFTTAVTTARAGSLVVGTPYTWDYLQKSGLRFGNGVIGLTSTEPSTERTWNAKSILGLTNLYEIYGATETGGVGWRSDFRSSFNLLPHLSQNDGIVTMTVGERYNLPIQDNLCWDTEGTFYVSGRKDDVIQIAGVNVSPERVKNTIQGIEGVSDVEVSYSDGQLRAVVYLCDTAAEDEAYKAKLGKQIAARLNGPARPTVLSFEPI